MANPQIIALQKSGNFGIVENDIVSILSKYASQENPLCSHEILGLASSASIVAIASCIKHGSSGYSVPSSWIGSVCADLARRKVISKVIKKCKFNNKDDDFWH
ncbi:hypothetical protein E9840_03550 [Tissierella creatinini]|nr:hypothetical protein E9840_03550 [Tissierella creatinini]TJX59365.1 hypothetical protein E8P77_21325 [Soehngenia saccharolytica]